MLDTGYGMQESPGIALALERQGIPVKVVGGRDVDSVWAGATLALRSVP